VNLPRKCYRAAPHRRTLYPRFSRSQRRLIAVAALAFVCLCGSVAVADDLNPRLDLWPLLRIRSSADGSKRSVEALGPLIEWYSSPVESRFFLRPLYNRRNDRRSRVTESEWLYPFGFGTRRPDLKRRVLFPLCVFDNDRFSDGSVQRRSIVLPLLYRRSGKGPADFFLFPFGGVIHDFFGRDRIMVILWPLYVHQQNNQAQSWSFLHPVFSRIRWQDGGSGFKVWPLFGINRRPEKMLKLFVLWPVAHYQRMKLERGELRRWWIWPFYGRLESPGGWEWSVLWPFFSHRVDRTAGREDWWYPWPFLGRRTGLTRDGAADRDLSGWTFWPVFSTERRGRTRTAQFLWPFGWYRRATEAGKKVFSFRIVPLMFRQREESEAGRTGAWQLWPLMKYRREADGRRELEFPSLMPMRHFSPWERNFAPLFRVFSYHRSPEGTRSWRLLWRLARVDSGPTGRYIEIAPLFKVRTRRVDRSESHWSLLRGLVGYARVGKRRSWRFLYFLRTGERPRAEAAGAGAK